MGLFITWGGASSASKVDGESQNGTFQCQANSVEGKKNLGPDSLHIPSVPTDSCPLGTYTKISHACMTQTLFKLLPLCWDLRVC